MEIQHLNKGFTAGGNEVHPGHCGRQNKGVNTFHTS